MISSPINETCCFFRYVIMGPTKLLLCGSLLLLVLAGCTHVPPPSFSLEQYLGKQKTFDYQGVKINYYEAGQGPPIILLHGFGGCAYSWRFLAPVLAQDHRVYTIDLKGFGLSDKPAGWRLCGQRPGRYRGGVYPQPGLARPGHDGPFHGRRRDPDDLFAGAAGPARTDQTPGAHRQRRVPQKLPWFIWLAQAPGLASVGGKLVSPRLAATLVLKKCYYDDDKITEEQIDTYAYYGSLPGAREAVVQTAKQIVPADIDALIAQYKTISVPVLIIWGEEDEVVPLAVGKKFKRDIPDSQLVILPKCGHMPPEEEPGATTRLIQEFLRNSV